MHSIKDAPLHLIHTLQLLAKRSDEVKAVVSEVIICGAYSAHSEKLLTSILCSDKQEDRKFAVNKILEVRGGKKKLIRVFISGETLTGVPRLSLSQSLLVR